MSDTPCEDLVAQERAAIIAWALSRGKQMTTRQIAERLGTTYTGAWFMMQKLARVLPIAFDAMNGFDDEGYWFATS